MDMAVGAPSVDATFWPVPWLLVGMLFGLALALAYLCWKERGKVDATGNLELGAQPMPKQREVGYDLGGMAKLDALMEQARREFPEFRDTDGGTEGGGAPADLGPEMARDWPLADRWIGSTLDSLCQADLLVTPPDRPQWAGPWKPLKSRSEAANLATKVAGRELPAVARLIPSTKPGHYRLDIPQALPRGGR